MSKASFRLGVAVVGLAAGFGAASHAATVTSNVIFGSGVTNGDFTVSTGTYAPPSNPSATVELGLRAKVRFDTNNNPQNVFNYDGDHSYNFVAAPAPGGFGWDPNSPTTPVWNFEWSIGSDAGTSGDPFSSASTVGELTYELRIDGDASAATDFAVFDPVNGLIFADHAFGNTSTAQSGGAVASGLADYAALKGSSSLVQNSWNYEFFNDSTDGLYLPQLAGFDPAVNGSYRIELEAFYDGQSVAMTGIDIITGTGPEPSPVPLPAGAPLLLAGLGAVAMLRRRR